MQRVVSLLITLFLCLSLDAAGTGGKKNIEKKTLSSRESVLAKAENLVLDRDRLKALNILSQAAVEAKQAEDQLFYWRKFDALARLFFTEEGQKQFELAQSLSFSENPSRAQAHFQQSLETEPHNFSMLEGYILYLLRGNKCKEAGEKWLGSKSLYSEYARYRELQRLIAVCEKDKESLLSAYKEAEDKQERNRHFYLAYISAASQSVPPMEIDEKKLDVHLPIERLYVLWWLSQQTQQTPQAQEQEKALSYAKTYVDYCSKLNNNLRRQFHSWPFLCRHDKELSQWILERESN